MFTSLYSPFKARLLKETSVVIQLAYRSIVHPKEVLEVMLVQVNDMIFLVGFFVIDMEDDKFVASFDLLLGRPFFSTTRTKLDVHDVTLTMEFDGEMIKFNVYNAKKFPSDVSSFVL